MQTGVVGVAAGGAGSAPTGALRALVPLPALLLPLQLLLRPAELPLLLLPLAAQGIHRGQDGIVTSHADQVRLNLKRYASQIDLSVPFLFLVISNNIDDNDLRPNLSFRHSVKICKRYSEFSKYSADLVIANFYLANQYAAVDLQRSRLCRPFFDFLHRLEVKMNI